MGVSVYLNDEAMKKLEELKKEYNTENISALILQLVTELRTLRRIAKI